MRELANGTLAMMSTVLGLELRSEASGLRFHDPVMGRNIPTRAETVAGWERAERLLEQEKHARERAERLREQEEQARQAAEARVAELEALLGGSTVEIPECDPAVPPTRRCPERTGQTAARRIVGHLPAIAASDCRLHQGPIAAQERVTAVQT